MTKKRCPGCGAEYDGKRCRVCFYTSFDAPEIPRPHRWETRSGASSRKIREPEFHREHTHGSGKRSPVIV